MMKRSSKSLFENKLQLLLPMRKGLASYRGATFHIPAFRQFFNEMKFVPLHMPKLVSQFRIHCCKEKTMR